MDMYLGKPRESCSHSGQSGSNTLCPTAVTAKDWVWCSVAIIAVLTNNTGSSTDTGDHHDLDSLLSSSNSSSRIHRDPPTCQVEHQPRQLPNGTCDYGICHARTVSIATIPTFPALESHILPQITPDCCRQHLSPITMSADKDPQGQESETKNQRALSCSQ